MARTYSNTVTYVRLQDQAIYKDEVLRQTEEANVIVASSYNAVAKWSLMNSLKFHNVLNIVYLILRDKAASILNCIVEILGCKLSWNLKGDDRGGCNTASYQSSPIDKDTARASTARRYFNWVPRLHYSKSNVPRQGVEWVLVNGSNFKYLPLICVSGGMADAYSEQVVNNHNSRYRECSLLSRELLFVQVEPDAPAMENVLLLW